MNFATLARLVGIVVALGLATSGSGLAQVSGGSPYSYHFSHVPFDGDEWLYSRREVRVGKGDWSEEGLERGGHVRIERARRLMTVANGGPVAERYVNVISDVRERRDRYSGDYEPVESGQLGEGRYQFVGTSEDGTVVLNGSRYDGPGEATMRNYFTAPWDWEGVAERLDGSTWRVGEVAAISPAEMKQMGLGDDGTAGRLELRRVGERWGRSVAEFAVTVEGGGEGELSHERVIFVDVETVRPILQTQTIRERVERVLGGRQFFRVLHARVERIYAFGDIPLDNRPLILLPSGFETPGDDNRNPIDIAVAGRGDTLYIHERTTHGKDRIGAWDILSRQPVAVRSVVIGGEGRLVASRSSDRLQVRGRVSVENYFIQGATLVPSGSMMNGGLDEPEITASAGIANYTLVGYEGGRVSLGHIGWRAEYGWIQVSDAAVVGIAASMDGGDVGAFATLDGAGDVRRHEVTMRGGGPCGLGVDLFVVHCDGLRVDIDASGALMNLAGTGCVEEAGDSLVMSPGGGTIGWTDFEAVDGACVRTGSSWLIEGGGGLPRRVAGSGLAFVDERRFVTSVGVFAGLAETPTVRFESPWLRRLNLERGVRKAVVSDSHGAAYLLVDGASGFNSIVEADLQTGIVVPISTQGGGPRPRSLGFSENEVFALLSDGSVVSEAVGGGRIHHYPAQGVSISDPGEYGPGAYGEARILDDATRLGLGVGRLGLYGRLLSVAGEENPENITSARLQLPVGTWFAGVADARGGTAAVAILGGVVVLSPGILPGGVEVASRDLASGAQAGTWVAVSGSGSKTRVVVSRDVDSGFGGARALDVYAVTPGGLVIERTILVEEARALMAVAGSAAHSDIVVGPLAPDPARSRWNPSGTFLRRISLETGRTVREVFSAWDGAGLRPQIEFSPDGVYLLQLTEAGGIRAYDMELGVDLGVLADVSGDIVEMRETSSGNWVTQGKTGITKVWDFGFIDITSHFSETANLLVRSGLLRTHQTLRATIVPAVAPANEPPRAAFIFTPDGYYSGDRSRLGELSFGDGSGAVDFEQYDLIANRPDITLSRLGLISERHRLRLFDAARKRQSRYGGNDAGGVARNATDARLGVSVDLREGASRISDGERLPVKVSVESSLPVRELVLRVNGTPVFRSGAGAFGNPLEVDVPLQSGHNVVTAHVRAEGGLSKSAQPVRVVRTGESEASRLYVFAVGVSDYRDDTLDLNYAAKDAADFAGYLRSTSSDVITRVVVDKNVSTSTLAEAQAFFSSARAGDRAILFLSGHGFLDERMDYYFAAHGFDRSSPSTGGFSMRDIDSVFDGSVVLNRAILIDSCHAGDFDEGRDDVEIKTLDGGLAVRGAKGLVASVGGGTEASAAYSTMKSVFADLNTRSGAHVIAASGGLEYAVEGRQWNNGVFTYSVLKALKSGAGDLDGDGGVEILELGAYVGGSVSELTAFRQVPSVRSANIRNNFEVAATAGGRAGW